MFRLLSIAGVLGSKFKPMLISLGMLAVRLLSTSVRMKRLVFIVSLFAHVRKIDACHMSLDEIERVTSELNCSLHLCSSEDSSLVLPLYLHDKLWEGDLESSEQVVDVAPSWMHYNRTAMLEDAKRVLTISAFTQTA